MRLTGFLLILFVQARALTVAVIGSNGRLGREIVKLLSEKGIRARCLLRHDVSTITPPASLVEAETSTQVAAFLQMMPGVEMIKGDINDEHSLNELVQGCDACIACHGAAAPKPFFRSLIFPSLFYPESTPSHPKQLNYQGIRNLLSAMEKSLCCKRLIRITGKGENPWSVFSILINALGGLAKAWNYEGEQLLRQNQNVDYTIIRPGVMKVKIDETNKVLGLKDNGMDMKVTAVSYQQIADLSVESMQYSNCARATLTAMNVPAGEGEDTYAPLLANVKEDQREFPDSLLAEHRKAARVGGLVITATVFFLTRFVVKTVLWGIRKLLLL